MIMTLKKRLNVEAEVKEKVELLEALGKEDELKGELRKLQATCANKAKKQTIHEHYAGPIFTFTMGTSVTWLIYTSVVGDIVLLSHGIWIQLLLLMSIILLKLIAIVIAKYKTPSWLFPVHVLTYAIYFICVMIVEFYYL